MGVRARRFVPYVTALPGSPLDGQEVYYVADATNGVNWHLRYTAAITKWVLVGGQPLQVYDVNQVTRASASFGDFSTAGPSLTIPLAGDYMVEWTTNVGDQNDAPSFDSFVGIKNAAVDPADADCLKFGFRSTQGSLVGRDVPQPMGVLRRTITVAAAGDILKMVARGSTAVSITYERRLIVATPIKVT
jgi:hypothetical protein